MIVYRKSPDGKWVCSWNCGFEHWDIEKVVEHENKGEHKRCHQLSKIFC